MQTAPKHVVAIVDDDDRTLASLGDLLEAAGFVVRAYSSATALLHERGLSGIDCLVSDIGMPDMSGLELRTLAGTERPDLPVILITGRPKTAGLETSDIDPKRYFEKPYDGRKLVAAISAVIADARGERS
jgi:FixJ family two-component response regulator